MQEEQIIIVGAGPAGLSAGGALRRQGLSALLLDRDEQIGGSWLRRYERLHLHTVRPWSGLAHYAIPRSYPWHMPRRLYAQYLQDYARRFALRVQLERRVARVAPEQHGTEQRWLIEADGERYRARAVVIATGQYGQPWLPEWPGLRRYQGQLIHSANYHSGRAYRGRRALVIGVGNSGAEIAADLAEQGAAQVAISIRTPPSIVPRELLGVPVQLFGMLLARLPARLADSIASLILRFKPGDLRRYGLRPPSWLPYGGMRIPTIDVGFLDQLRRGGIQPRPNVASFSEAGVRYDDGSEERFDLVVAATGFRTGLERLLGLPGLLDARGYPLARSAEPGPYPGLYFLGYTLSLRGELFETSRDSRRLARELRRYLG